MAITQLILLRHAKSDWHAGVRSDYERPLNKRGRKSAPVAGRWLVDHGYVPDQVMCSSAARAHETLELMMTQCDLPESAIEISRRLYHASVDDLLAEVDAHQHQNGKLLLVGHNPGLELLLLHYCPDLTLPPDGKLMTTAAIAVIDFEKSGAPELLHLQRPSL